MTRARNSDDADLNPPREGSEARVSTPNARKRATSYDVARLAGVSQSAVSRVFKSGASASSKMRKRVLAAASEIGYRPNAIARGLITQRSNMVGVVISRMTNLYYPELLVQLTQVFSERGIRVLLFTLEHESEINVVLEQTLQYQVDGIVTAAILTPAQLDMLGAAGIPVVLYNRQVAHGQAAAVRCDQEAGEAWLVRQLIDARHGSFAIISGPEDSTVSMERTTGALRHLSELGIRNVTVVLGDYSYDSGFSGILEIHERLGELPDAIIAANDAMAIGCIDAARKVLGAEVPESLSVVGFDGIGAAQYAAYQLTTVRQPVTRMTQATVDMLMQRIDDPELGHEQRIFQGTPVRGRSARLADSSGDES